MFSVMSDEALLAQAEQTLAARMSELISQKIQVKVGFLGQSFPLEVSWSDELGIWMSFQTSASSYWNAFGVQKPVLGRHTQIACEINIPLSGINRRIAGVVGASGRSPALIAHRGRIGGRSGVGKSLFVNRYAGAWEDFVDGNRRSQIALVGQLAAPQFPWQVADFVKQVDQIKRQVTNQPTSTALWQTEVPPSGEGAPEFHRSEVELLAQCDRGWVSTSLIAALGKHGLLAVPSGTGQLVARQSDLTLVFHIRTDINRASIHAGLGKLFLERQSGGREQLVLVTPPGLPTATVKRLTELGVQLIHYNLGLGSVDFAGLDGVLQEDA